MIKIQTNVLIVADPLRKLSSVINRALNSNEDKVELNMKIL